MHTSLSSFTGAPAPLGAHAYGNGARFAVFSRHATKAYLALFREEGDAQPYAEIELDPARNRTGDIWHIEVASLEAGSLYLWRFDGPVKPEEGLLFNPDRYLLDPYARALTAGSVWRVRNGNRDAYGMPKCILVADDFDWGDDRPLNYPLAECVVYETHVRGQTAHPSSGVAHPGTYRGIVEMIPYFTELGITTLELLPVHAFDPEENENSDPETGERLVNYWGYSTIAFFAPMGLYSADGTNGEQVNEFKFMVKSLHEAGIEVVLDVVFNHTGEAGPEERSFMFRGIDNPIYYIVDEHGGGYRDYSGCGNTVNCNHPVVRDFVVDCLRYWVIDMHVDGFRFDLASILSRGTDGEILDNPPLIERIAEDPILRSTKLIAEAWDAGGAYHVGRFPGGRWAEWNDKYRDAVRRFWRGDLQMVSEFATRLAGSSDLYRNDGRKPYHSVNFVTAHDGFTLNDLVSYERKHNQRNGEQNRDGSDANYSSNYGVEGYSSNPRIRAIRNRQVKNFIATLFISVGTPMFLGGDEFRRTQQGNNNAFCQDNELSWFNYGLAERHGDVLRFAREMIGFRRRHPSFRRPEFLTGTDTNNNLRLDVAWYDEHGRPPDWSRAQSALALWLDGAPSEIHPEPDPNDFYLMFNPYPEVLTFTVPKAPAEERWKRLIDTARESPYDICSDGPAGDRLPEAPSVEGRSVELKPYSFVVLAIDGLRGANA
jgi:glycogen operon protein